jgi:5'-nucleotidase
LDTGLENKGSGGYLQWHNIEYNQNDNTWSIGGQPLDESKTYHIVSSDYLASGNENRLEFFNPKNFVKTDKPKEGDKSDLRSDVRKAVIEYMKSR